MKRNMPQLILEENAARQADLAQKILPPLAMPMDEEPLAAGGRRVSGKV